MTLMSQKLGLIYLALAALVIGRSAFGSSDRVRIETGVLQGKVQDGVVSFKGIPYATPPVGVHRWRAPQPVAAWTGVRQATEYGHDCMQILFPIDAAALRTVPSEDCLYLNVWKPAQAPSKKLAVMVWFYGGGWMNGGSSPAAYDGTEFARSGLVFVSFNYRLGRFGFFAHPALTRENPNGLLGNYGYMDQIAALKWVQQNIAAFGGDPQRVTVFGESAGGGSIQALICSPVARGLFQRAIVDSSGGRTALGSARYIRDAPPGGLPSAESVGVTFARSKNIFGTDRAALSALRDLTADQVADGLSMANEMDSDQKPKYTGAMIDGKVVVETSQACFGSGRFAQIPLLVGANSREQVFPRARQIGLPHAHTLDELFAGFGKDGDKARALYDPQNTASMPELGLVVAADQMMVEPARYVARSFAAARQPVYEYRFSYVADSMRGEWKGAPHATELVFAFNTVRARYGDAVTPNDEKVAQSMHAYWVAFAKSGNPNAGGRPKWPRYSLENDQLMNFTAGGAFAEPDPWKARLDLIEASFLASQKTR
jgi:para-nitrobenzyl esterase